MTRRIFSGIQPTHHLHLGNYLGAIQQWVHLQDTCECLFSIVNLHALTMPWTPETLRRHVLETAACYLACGLDPKRATVFVQGDVPAHTELAWILGCTTPMGWLNRMTQFKEKSAGTKQQAGLGLYAYPVLMAADILLYQTTHVPVGDDQKQHLELARDIALSFNSFLDRDVFVVPAPLILEQGARIMSLKDGTEKMSKSHPNDATRIHLNDSPDVIAWKIQKARTDSDALPDTVEGLAGRPEARNLLTMIAVLQGYTLEEMCTRYAGQNFARLKADLVEATEAVVNPVRRRMEDFLKHPDHLTHVLEQGATKAAGLAAPFLQHVREAAGLALPLSQGVA